MTQPTRPQSVPPDAEYFPDWKEWGQGKRVDGKMEGMWRIWRADDGQFVEEGEWSAGESHGVKRRFHDDGSLAAEAELVHNRTIRYVQKRTASPTREANLQGMHASIAQMTYLYRYPDSWTYSQTFHDAAGIEVDVHAEPVPARVPGVPDTAYWNSKDTVWCSGEWTSIDGKVVRRKLYGFWSVEGQLVHLEYYANDGVLAGAADTRNVSYKGSPLVAAAAAGDEASVETCLQLGLGHVANVALHAAHDGLFALALRVQALPPGPAFPEARADVPDCRGDIAADAVWVPGLSRWVRGEYDANKGLAVGTWDLWDAPKGYTFVFHEQADFVDGRRVGFRKMKGDKPEREVRYDETGAEILERKWNDGAVKETESLREKGEVVKKILRVRSKSGALLEECIVEKDGAHHKIFAEDGTLRGEGPRKVTEGRASSMTGTWCFFDKSGQLVEKADLRKKPWRTFAEEDPAHVVELVMMSKLESPLGTEAAKINWSKLTDEDDCSWYAFNEIADEVPLLVAALEKGDAELARSAWSTISYDTLHQGTIYESSALLTPLLIRMLKGSPSSPDYIFDLLNDYADGLRAWLPNLEASDKSKTAKWLRKMGKAFSDSLDFFVKMAGTHADGKMRTRAIALLAQGVFGDDCWPAVWSLYGAEQDVTRRAQLALTLAPLAKDASALDAMSKALTEEKHAGVRFGLARSCVEAAGELKQDIPTEAIAVLLEYAVKTPSELAETYGQLTGEAAKGTETSNVAILLARSPAPLPVRLAAATRLMPVLLEQFRTAKSILIVNEVQALLFITQPHDSSEAKSPELLAMRREVIRAFSDLEERWWEWVNLLEVLENFHVPRTHPPATMRDTLRTFAASDAPWSVREASDDDESDESEDEN